LTSIKRRRTQKHVYK